MNMNERHLAPLNPSDMLIHPVGSNLDRKDENYVLVYIRVIPTRFLAYISDSDRNLPWRATPNKKVSRLTGIQIIPTDTEVGSLQNSHGLCMKLKFCHSSCSNLKIRKSWEFPWIMMLIKSHDIGKSCGRHKDMCAPNSSWSGNMIILTIVSITKGFSSTDMKSKKFCASIWDMSLFP